MGPAAYTGRAGLCGGCGIWRRDPRGTCGGQSGHLVLDRQFETQSCDPMFLEPESGLAWYDPGRKTLELVIGVQSPYEAAESIAFLLGKAQGGLKPAHINTQSAYVGGGFGGRDHTPFPLYVALAAMFFPGHPVRLANNRHDQFQSGIKRHGFSMHTWMGVDRATGKMFAFAADHVLQAGGLANFLGPSGDGRRQRRARYLLRSEERYHHGLAVFARRDRGLYALLRHATDDDGTRGAGR